MRTREMVFKTRRAVRADDAAVVEARRRSGRMGSPALCARAPGFLGALRHGED